MSLTILGFWRASAGESEAVAQRALAVALVSRLEPGCLEYRVHRDRADPREFVLFERYTNRAAVEAHRASEHFQKVVLADIVPRLERREVRMLEELTAEGDDGVEPES
jgi:quinol monooxygenase YgiN